MHKNDAFDAKIVNTRLTKIFIVIFAPDVRLPSSATLAHRYVGWRSKHRAKGPIFASDPLCTPLVCLLSGAHFLPSKEYEKCFNNICIKHPCTETSQSLQLLPISPLVVDKTVVEVKYWLENL